MRRPSIALFTLAGFGNSIIPALAEAEFTPTVVVTRKETGPYPYYPVESIEDLTRRMGILCVPDVEGEAAIDRSPVDLLLVATYHRILKVDLVVKMGAAVNLHPSLLPAGRGPNPFFWSIRNGDEFAGVTAHALSAKPDAGPVLWSQALRIADDESQGSLRQRLASVAATGAVIIARSISDGTVKTAPQDESLATSFGRPKKSDFEIRPEFTVLEASRCIRAASPYPGAAAGPYVVIAFAGSAPASPVPPGTIVKEEGTTCRMRVADGDVLFRVRPDR